MPGKHKYDAQLAGVSLAGNPVIRSNGPTEQSRGPFAFQRLIS